MENQREICNTGEHAGQMSEHTRNKNDPPVVSKDLKSIYIEAIYRPGYPPPPPKGLENRYFTGDVAE